MNHEDLVRRLQEAEITTDTRFCSHRSLLLEAATALSQKDMVLVGAPERLQLADPDDEKAYEKAIKENDEYVGACQYRGNTVSYIHGKAENYGRELLECWRLSGAKSGQSVMDRIKELTTMLSAHEADGGEK